MSIVHHPDPATLMAFSAASLSAPFAALVAAHLEWCPACRAAVRGLDRLGGALLAQTAPVPMSEAALEEALARLDGEVPEAPPRLAPRIPDAAGLPRPLAHHAGGGLAAVRWRWLAPGVEQAILWRQKGSSDVLRLLRIEPGRRIPEHGHGGEELTLVLAGGFHDHSGHYEKGDVAEHDEAAEHEPQVDGDEPCLCAIASGGGVRFKRLKHRLLQPLLGV